MTELRLVLRKTRAYIPQLLGLVLLLAVGIAFFITLFTIAWRYEETAERYFVDNAYADVTLCGAFDDDSLSALARLSGVIKAAGRTVRDLRADDVIYRTISLTGGINEPHLYEGRLPRTVEECVLLRRNADAMGLAVGDTLTLGGKSVTIVGLAASPEYIYLSKNDRSMTAQPSTFAVLFVTADYYPPGYNEIVALTSGDFQPAAAAAATGAFQVLLRNDRLNHYLYRSDLGEIRSFAYIFPLIFAALIAVVIFVMLTRSIQMERRQIGTMKALGLPDGRIVRVYLARFCVAAMAGGVLGCLLAMVICDFIIGIFASMFEVPTLSFAVYPTLWLGAVAAAVALCAISGLVALRPVLSLLPAQAMRPRLPSGGGRTVLERFWAWRRLSFNTRYALKNALRNKGRFFAVVLGMCGSCALMVFSLGFNNSIVSTQDEYFKNFANYDVIISFNPLPLTVEHPSIERIDTAYKALVLPVEIEGGQYTLAVLQSGFDMVNIPSEALQEGVLLPEYYAGLWRVNEGDSLNVGGYEAKISAVTPQHLGLTLYTGFDYLSSIASDAPLFYNAIYARDGDMDDLAAYLNDDSIDYVTIDDDSDSFAAVMESMSVLIWFMIACSVVLGFTVLYSVGMINLSAREYEYMFMGVMGYPHRAVMAAHALETLMQLLLALPLGFVLGNLLLDSVKGEFSGNSFVILAAVFPESYALSALGVLAVTAAMAWVTSRHIAALDIVEGLKAQDE